jgi:hypothetical protein
MEIVSNGFCCLRPNDIIDTVPKRINVSVDAVAADSYDVSAWVAIINREVGLEVTDVFGSPTIVNQLSNLLLNRSRGRRK